MVEQVCQTLVLLRTDSDELQLEEKDRNFNLICELYPRWDNRYLLVTVSEFLSDIAVLKVKKVLGGLTWP